MEVDRINNKDTVITIGTFDGVHIGHQKIIQRLIEVGKTKDLTPTILSFFPHPRMVLQKDANIKLLNTLEEKKNILKQFGLDNLIIKKFTQEFSRLTAEEFVETVLVKQLNAKYIIIGYDHQFGRNRTANINDLKNFGNQYGFEVEEITAQDIDDVSVSSTKIRKALTEGDITTANNFLGYPFIISGTVEKGKGLGRTINFPTANIAVSEDYKLIPKQGVYIVKTNINNEIIYGMMNIGTNPTVNGKTQTIEVHFFNFKNNIYNQEIKIELLQRLRDEQKFESIDALTEQLVKDKNNALRYINTND
ncbi:riboflavin kinase/FMN adenylyltransferase [Lacinutrix venerupis]|uniref:bifunctional riboflavin kinase/FAD synthetase n=1 Tax=Lacinutrix venerupis TaxID=1486034 RepID=UPI000EAF331F|nr:bifunctional riboflavin kinase/FAD synthetase [Lacinutrix venerupis]RLJ65579.1 riboflavin kinase/FMN adenylyltransferase [Lacinutrix venerupis]